MGGLLGARYLGEAVGINNLITADMGGTSFDVGLVTEGKIPLVREPEFARFIFNLPMVTINSVGAGAGTFIRLDPMTKRIMLGPESAGAEPGPVCYDHGIEIPTVVDCDLICGVVNPDYYLGGKIKLNKEKALRRFREDIADPLGLNVYEAAEGVVGLVNAVMRDQIRSLVLAKGYATADYTLIAFGGAGPMHMSGFTERAHAQGAGHGAVRRRVLGLRLRHRQLQPSLPALDPYVRAARRKRRREGKGRPGAESRVGRSRGEGPRGNDRRGLRSRQSQPPAGRLRPLRRPA